MLVALGQIMRIWAAGCLTKSEQLTHCGPFSMVRNPLYIGSFLITCGYCWMTGEWLVWAIVIPLFIAFHGAAIVWEERFLRWQFGEAFDDYCMAVPRVIPRFTARPRCRCDERFSFKQVKINKEDKTILGAVAVALAFGLKLFLGW